MAARISEAETVPSTAVITRSELWEWQFVSLALGLVLCIPVEKAGRVTMDEEVGVDAEADANVDAGAGDDDGDDEEA